MTNTSNKIIKELTEEDYSQLGKPSQAFSPTVGILENKKTKHFFSPDYNYIMDKNNGNFMRWGKTEEDDPQRSKYGSEIADIEITTICNGPGGKLCPFCYKSNTNDGHNMTIDEFKTIFHKIPKTLTQIAFGADAQAITNPDLFKMMEYCRNNDYNKVAPNITVADLNDNEANKIAELCGAVAVSYYKHAGKDICYDTIKKLTDRGMKQVNIHYPLMKSTFIDIDELINDIKTDDRLKGLNAVVFLSLKQKGRGENYQQCSQEEFNELVEKMFINKIPHGMDSCSAIKYLSSIQDREDKETLMQMIDPCESTKFSLYINEKGKVFPCSFMENTEGFWEEERGFDMLDESFVKNPEEFLNKIWNSNDFLEFGIESSKCNSCGEGCQFYEI